MPVEKKTESVKVWLTPDLELSLRRYAEQDGRGLSDYIGRVLHFHVYGRQGPRTVDDTDKSVRDE